MPSMILFLMLLNKNSAYDSEVPCMDEQSLIRKVIDNSLQIRIPKSSAQEHDCMDKNTSIKRLDVEFKCELAAR